MSLTSRRPYLIRAMYEWMADNELTPHLIVDATHEGVVAPSSAIQDGKVVLNISMKATRNLELGNEFVYFDARFSGVAQQVTVPVAAVMAIYSRENNEGLAFAPEPIGDAMSADDNGPDIGLALVDPEASSMADPVEPASDNPEDSDDNNGTDDEGPDDGGNEPPRRGHLSVVK